MSKGANFTTLANNILLQLGALFGLDSYINQNNIVHTYMQFAVTFKPLLTRDGRTLPLKF